MDQNTEQVQIWSLSMLFSLNCLWCCIIGHLANSILFFFNSIHLEVKELELEVAIIFEEKVIRGELAQYDTFTM